MSPLPGNAIRLSNHNASPGKSKVRLQFNTLVTKLENERKRLAAWHDTLPKIRARADAELAPIGKEFLKFQRELVLLFDRAHGHKLIKKKEREKLSDIICGLALELLDKGEDEELAAIYERHSGEAELADDPEFLAFNEVIEQLFKDMEGPGGDPFGLPGSEQEDAAPQKAAGQRRAGKPSAQATRKEEEEKRLTQTVREIFRKLASDLHPDRESDPAERERKTGLMQRVNVAYAANDLLSLLELQFEVDQIDAAALDTLGDERIKQYNKVLTKQVADVRREIDELEQYLSYELHISSRGRLTPAQMEKTLTQDVEGFKANLAGIKSDLRDFQDIKTLKAFLKTYQVEEPFDFMDDGYF